MEAGSSVAEHLQPAALAGDRAKESQHVESDATEQEDDERALGRGFDPRVVVLLERLVQGVVDVVLDGPVAADNEQLLVVRER